MYWIEATDPDANEPPPTHEYTGMVTVNRSGALINTWGSAFLHYHGSATYGTDYEPMAIQVVFLAGESSKSLVLTPYADQLFERTEEAHVTINYVTQGSIDPTRKTAIVYIADGPIDGPDLPFPEPETSGGVRTRDPETCTGIEQTGNVQVVQGLDLDAQSSCECSCGGAEGLVYNSDTVAPRPIVQATVGAASGGQLPDQIRLQLTWNGVAQPEKTYDVAGMGTTAMITGAVQVASPVATGRHDYSLRVVWDFEGDDDPSATFAGQTYIVAAENTVIGRGWSLGFVDRLVPILEGNGVLAGLLRVYGNGAARFFAAHLGSYLSPPEDRGTLTAQVGGYLYTAPDGATRTYNAEGLVTDISSPDGFRHTLITYTDGDNDGTADEVATVRAFDNTLSTFSYAGGKLIQINSLGRLTTLHHTGDDLTQIVKACGCPRDFTYDTTGLMLSDAQGGTVQSWTYVNGLARTHQAGSSAANTTTIQSANSRGLIHLWTGAVTADITDPLGRVTRSLRDYRNWISHHKAADGGMTQYERNARQDVIKLTDPMLRETNFVYDHLGFVTHVLLADGAMQIYEYDATLHHNLIRTTDERGYITNYGYNSHGQLTSMTDPLGRTWSFLWSGGNLTGVTDPLAHATQYAYDSQSRLTSVTDPLGNVTRYTLDQYGNVTEMILPETEDYPDGRRWTFIYNVAGLPTQAQAWVAGSGIAMYTAAYNSLGLLLSETDALGRVRQYQYDDRGLTTAASEAVGTPLERQVQYGYDAAGQLVSVTDPLNRTTTLGYDAVGRLRLTVNALNHQSSAAYNRAGEVRATYDALGNETRYGYTVRGQVLGVVDALNNFTQYEYDPTGNLVLTVDPLGTVQQSTYDAAGQLTQVQQSGGGLSRTWTASYDGAGKLFQMTDPLGRKTRLAYDAADQLTGLTEAYGTASARTTSLEYDPAGQMLRTVDPAGLATRYGYDFFGQAVSITEGETTPLERTRTFGYDLMGNLLSVTEPLPNNQTRQTQYGYDTLDRRTQITDALNGVTALEYDAANQLTRLVDPVGNATIWVYDSAGRVSSETNALGYTRQYAYDAASQLTQLTDRNGRVRQFSYDALHRLTAEVWKDGSITVNTLSYAYDEVSRLVSAGDDGSSTVTFAYDGLGRPTTETQAITGGVTAAFTHAWNLADERTSLVGKVNGLTDFTNTYQYDVLGRMTRLTQSGTAVAPKRVDLAYNVVDQLTSVTRYADLEGFSQAAQSTYQYDALHRITQLAHARYGNTLHQYDYTWDVADRLTQIVSSADGTANYSYDVTDQLASALYSGGQANEIYLWDANGNRTNGGQASGSNNQLTSDGTYTYLYDQEGNRIRKTRISTGTYEEYTWDYRNRLTKVATKTAGGLMTEEVSYTYDAFDRLIGRQYDPDGDGYAAATNAWYAYDGQHLALRLDDYGNVRNRYLHGPAVDMVLADEQVLAPGQPGTVRWALTDHLGSVRDLVDNGGVVINHVRYSAFGQIVSETNPVTDHLFAYTGRILDRATGLQNHRARWYDPRVQRWTSEDPVGFNAGDTNLNRMVGNEPTKYIDPSGMDRILFRPTKDGILVYYLDEGMIYDEDPVMIGIIDPKDQRLLVRHHKFYVPLKTVINEIDGCGTTGNWDKWFEENTIDPHGLNWANALAQLADYPGIYNDLRDTIEHAKWLARQAIEFNAGGAFSAGVGKAAGVVFLVRGARPADIAKHLATFKFTGARRIDALRTATHQDIVKAFEGTCFTPSNHFIMRLKHVRTQDLGLHSFKDLEEIFRKGAVGEVINGKRAITYGRFNIWFDADTGVLVTIEPR